MRRNADGRLVGDMFDGEGFVRGVAHNGATLEGQERLVVGSRRRRLGDRGLLRRGGRAEIALYDVSAAAMEALGGAAEENYPNSPSPSARTIPRGFDVVVNATPLGTYPGDPMPIDVARLRPRPSSARS